MTRKEEAKQLIAQGKKRCSACKEIKPLIEITKDARRKSGYGSQCKECHDKKTAETRRLPDKIEIYWERKRESARRHALKVREKARIRILSQKSGTGDRVPGYIYIFQWDRFYKIGRARQPHVRARRINKSLPFEGELIHTVRTDDMVHAEILIHDKFAKTRQCGEWFLLSQTDIEYLLKLDFLKCKTKAANQQEC